MPSSAKARAANSVKLILLILLMSFVLSFSVGDGQALVSCFFMDRPHLKQTTGGIGATGRETRPVSAGEGDCPEVRYWSKGGP